MKTLVGTSCFAVSANAADVLVTHGLGSCLGVAIHDAQSGVAGLLHAMLPSCGGQADNPACYVDSGLDLLISEAIKLGFSAERGKIFAAGAGWPELPDNAEDFFRVGGRNVLTLREILWRKGLFLAAGDFGGPQSRSLSVCVATGEVTVFSSGYKKVLSDTGK